MSLASSVFLQSDSDGAGEQIDKLLMGLNFKEQALMEICKQEILALRATGSIGHPSLVRLLSAHLDVENGGKTAHLVMEKVRPEGLHGASISEKLSAIQTFFSAIAALHAAGIVHRDIKYDNIGTKENDPGVAVIIDLGQALLPVGRFEDS